MLIHCNPACRTLSAAESLVSGRLHATAIALDVRSPDLDPQVAKHDVVISLVPFAFHADIINSAIKGHTHVVTTSYISSAIRELDESIKQAGITVLNEVGMDPGIGLRTLLPFHLGQADLSPKITSMLLRPSTKFMKKEER